MSMGPDTVSFIQKTGSDVRRGTITLSFLKTGRNGAGSEYQACSIDIIVVLLKVN